MPTMQEVRAKYPQYSDMSDDALAGALYKKYYSDMPREEFDAKLGLKPAAPASKGTVRGTILPFEKNLDTGETSWAMPSLLSGILESGAAAVTAPGRAMNGELPMTGPDGRTSPEAIAEAANMATWATPTSPAAGTGVGIARTYEAAHPNELLKSADRLGVSIPKAIASESASVQQAGKLLSNVPLAGQPLRKAATKTISQLDDAAKAVQTKLGRGEAGIAGEGVTEGVKAFSKDVLGGRITALEDDLAKSVDPAKLTPLAKTRSVVAEIVSGRNRAALSGEGKAAGLVKEAISRDGLSFDGIRTLRTSIREMLDNPSLVPADISQAELKRIYTSLSDDLRSAAANAGGKEGLAKFELANKTEALIARDRQALQKVLGKDLSGEKVADRIIAMAGNNSRADMKTLMLVRKSVSKETWDELASAAFAKMGRDAEGNLTPDRMVTAWGKLSPSGKKMLFTDEATRQSIDDIVKVSSRFKQLNQYANPSGTGQTVLGGAIGSGLIAEPVTAISSTLGAYGASLILSRPATARATAEYSKAYEMAVRAPGKSSQMLLNEKARKLALIVANDAGNPDIAGSIASKLSAPQKAAADDGNNQGVGNPEGQPDTRTNEQRFNDAYLQGNAT